MCASGFAWKTIFGKAIEGKENKNIAIKREREREHNRGSLLKRLIVAVADLLLRCHFYDRINI